MQEGVCTMVETRVAPKLAGVHETILGEDPFVGIRFDKPHVRLQCEREFKAMLVRLRQGYIAAGGTRDMVRDLLIATAKNLAPLLRALLWLVDAERPKTMEATLRQAGAEFKVDLTAVLAAHDWRRRKLHLTDAEMEAGFVTIVNDVDRLTSTVDGLKV